MKRAILFMVMLGCFLASKATPTKLMVRVKAKDAKFIGTPIGGAYVVIRNDLTGEVLAKGLTKGISGDTKLLLQTPLERGKALTDEKTAGFLVTLDIDEPLLVDVEVVAPVNRRAAAAKGSTQLWLIPGKDIVGDGIIIELPGYLLDILAPTSHQMIALSSVRDRTVGFRVSLAMLCGCPITKGGVWDSDEIQLKAILKKDGVVAAEYAVRKLPETNLYDGSVEITGVGAYELLVYAYNPKDNNTGIDRINFVVQ
jgi:hypothetical protein